MVSQGEFYDLRHQDSIKVKEIIFDENSDIKKSFKKEDLEKIYSLSKLKVWWNSTVINIPQVMIKDKEIVFDADEICR